MRIHVAFTPGEAAEAPFGIVVDVLRATSTIAQALAAGFARELADHAAEAGAVALYESADAERLERELLKLAKGVVDGRFEPSAEPHFALCADCPGRAALCVHDETLTERAVRQAGGGAPGAGFDFSVGTPS